MRHGDQNAGCGLDKDCLVFSDWQIKEGQFHQVKWRQEAHIRSSPPFLKRALRLTHQPFLTPLRKSTCIHWTGRGPSRFRQREAEMARTRVSEVRPGFESKDLGYLITMLDFDCHSSKSSSPICRVWLMNDVTIFQWKTLWESLHDTWRHCKSFDVAYPWKWLLIESALTVIPFREQRPLQNWAWQLLKSSTPCLHGTRRRKLWPTMQSDAGRPWTTASKPRLKAWKQRENFYQLSANKTEKVQWACDHSKRTLVFLITFRPWSLLSLAMIRHKVSDVWHLSISWCVVSLFDF